MISQWVSNQTVDAAHWLIGEGLMTDGKALRSMKDPGTANQYDDQIKNYRDYRPDMDVHTSSGIANYAFYLACKNVGGNSWEKIGKVWYITNTARLRHNSGFQDAGNHTFDVAGSLFGEVRNRMQYITPGMMLALMPKNLTWSLMQDPGL
jgi:Zn-dependent metalloprotease